MAEENLPRGAPGRKSFVFIPKQKKVFKRSGALKLRQVHYVMFFIHLFCLCIVDVYIHEWEIIIMVADTILLWFNFYNYMTVNKITSGINAVLYGVFTLVAWTHLQRILFGDESWSVILFFFIQFFGAYPAGCYFVASRLLNHQKE